MGLLWLLLEYFSDNVFVPFSFFLYTFWSLLVFCWKTNMVGLDFWDTQFSLKFTPELFKYCLFQKLSKNFCFHRDQCKMQIMYGNAHDNWCTVFQNCFQFFIGHASFFQFALCLFAKIVFRAVQNSKGKLTFRKIENIQPCHFVSSVAQKRNPPNFSNFSCI